MSISIAKAEPYFVYVLRLEQDRWYVGSTKNIEKRMRTHFARGGAIATRECCPASIEVIYRFIDYQIRTDCAHERAEAIVAARLAEKYGRDNVRGAKHGKGWSDEPSRNNLRDIERYQRFSVTPDGLRLMAVLHPVPVHEAISEETSKLLSMYRDRRVQAASQNAA
jgi:predicted GIY-YIG superfamily endonuclease